MTRPNLYRIDGPTARVEYYRRTGETSYAVHVYDRIGSTFRETTDLSEHRFGPERVEESVEKARECGFSVTTPYDDDLTHEQNH